MTEAELEVIRQRILSQSPEQRASAAAGLAARIARGKRECGAADAPEWEEGARERARQCGKGEA